MRPNKLLNLLAANRKRGEFRAEGNTIFVYDVLVSSDADAEWFGGVSAEGFAKQLASMSGPVLLRINSPGGDVFAGMAMAQAIRSYDGEVTAQVDGVAASAASVVAVAADKTTMAQGSMMMVHNAWTIALGNASDFRETAALLDKIDGEIVGIYEAKAGEGQDFAAMMAEETWLTGKEAIAAGLADEESAAKIKNQLRWDLSAFSNVPDVEPEAPPEPVAEVVQAQEPDENEIERRARQHRVRMLQNAA